MNIFNKKILITGSSGFVGAVLLRRIIEDHPKAKVFILLRESSNTWRINDLLKKVKVINVDLRDQEKLKKEVKKIKPNIIFHLATYGAYSSENSLELAVETNVVGTKNLLLALENINYDLFVNTGSSSEYGYKDKPMKEDDLLVPASYYAATKASATHLASTYGLINNRPIVTLRLFSVYGPYEEPGRFFPTAIISSMENKEINVVKGPTRDFIYVDDVIDAYIACTKLKEFDERIFNVCSGKQIGIEDAANKIVSLTGSSSEIKVGVYKPRPWDTNYWVGSNKLIKARLKWRPKYEFDEGVLQSAAWFSENKKYYA